MATALSADEHHIDALQACKQNCATKATLRTAHNPMENIYFRWVSECALFYVLSSSTIWHKNMGRKVE